MSGENSKKIVEEAEGVSPEGAEETAAADDAAASEKNSIVKRIGLRFGRGATNVTAGLLHTIATSHQTDDEMRRILVERQLNAFEGRREVAREELEDVYKRLTRLETRGAEDGWTDAEKEEVSSLRAERKARERALKDLLKADFAPVQPSREQIKRARGKSSIKRVVGLSILAVVAVGVTVVLPRLLLLGVPVLTAVLWWKGGEAPVLTQRGVPERLLRPELDAPALGDSETEPELAKPFPIHEADTPERATDCVQRALLAEDVDLQQVYPAIKKPWGWQATVVLRSGTSADVVRILKDLDTRFRVGHGRTLAAGNPADGAEVTVRIMTSDPFANAPDFPARAPKSTSIRQSWSPGISVEGEETPLVLLGLHVLVVADTGGGKSLLVRSLADYVTACTDAIVVDIDPTGRGLGPLRRAAYRTARTPEETEEVLEWLVEVAEGRTTRLGDTEDVFPVTDQEPAIFGLVDEYPQLTKRGKKAALKLLRIGRKARVNLVICTQDATSDILGDAVADAFQIRIMLPCRQADVPLVVGRSAAISEGWLPHFLVPGDEEDPADAGRFYIISARHRAPILRYVIPLDPEIALERAKERVAAGLPTLDRVVKASAVAPATEIGRLFMDVFEAAEEEALPVGDILDHLAQAKPDTWGQWASDREQWADDPAGRLREGGKAIGRAVRKEGLDLSSRRLEELPGRPTGYRLADLRAALTSSAD
ncbi:hypothetical protein TPA0598_17_00200 [Streptomyces lydicamycinicus]|uniref:FtsK domain-containing protein n=1 Tax=Streptomyces lydicamycinicus TaxID=1546107 RepID=A0A0P4RGX9_9ACTN|nr:hypothetical protein [Streptomyces lydicamycinicus]GAO13039.1 hypothetical protein TPA0598_17_00200 [Streptomyces lydicamycinicus]